jgi:hypothetical protein
MIKYCLLLYLALEFTLTAFASERFEDLAYFRSHNSMAYYVNVKCQYSAKILYNYDPDPMDLEKFFSKHDITDFEMVVYFDKKCPCELYFAFV